MTTPALQCYFAPPLHLWPVFLQRWTHFLRQLCDTALFYPEFTLYVQSLSAIHLHFHLLTFYTDLHFNTVLHSGWDIFGSFTCHAFTRLQHFPHALPHFVYQAAAPSFHFARPPVHTQFYALLLLDLTPNWMPSVHFFYTLDSISLDLHSDHYFDFGHHFLYTLDNATTTHSLQFHTL